MSSGVAQVIVFKGEITSSTWPALFHVGDEVYLSYTLATPLTDTLGAQYPGQYPGVFFYASASTVLKVGNTVFPSVYGGNGPEMSYLGLHDPNPNNNLENPWGYSGFGTSAGMLGTLGGFGGDSYFGLYFFSRSNVVTSENGLLLPLLPFSDFDAAYGSLGVIDQDPNRTGFGLLGRADWTITSYSIDGQQRSAVPELSTCSLILGVASLGMVFRRRRHQARTEG